MAEFLKSSLDVCRVLCGTSLVFTHTTLLDAQTIKAAAIIEAQRNKKSYATDTLAEISRIYGGVEFNRRPDVNEFKVKTGSPST